jgi:phosphomethylpyrimidine synthase
VILFEQAEQGFFSPSMQDILRYIHLTAERVTGIVSRGGSIMANGACFTIKKTLYTHFEDICEIMKQYDVLSLLVMVCVQVLLPMPMMPRNSLN